MMAEESTGATHGTASPGDKAASRFMLSLFVAAILTIGANIALREFTSWPDAVRVLLAVISVPALVAMILYGPRALRAMDELEQRIHLEALAYSFGVLGLLLVVYGQIQTAFGLKPEPWTMVWPMMFCIYLASLLLVRRRYQ
jgi:hypothetical protein